MPLTNATCTNCGATLRVENTKDAAVCPYCGSAFIVEKAINNYNTINNIQASVVNIYGGNSADFAIRGGVLERYNGASTVVTIPNTVRCIGVRAFKDTYIEKVIIPDSVQEISDKAFYNCRALKEVIIPDSVIDIGSFAFFSCFELRVVRLSKSIGEIKDGTFANCINLTSIIIPKSVTKIATYDSHGFLIDPVRNCKIYTGPDEGSLYSLLGSFINCPNLTDVVIENEETAKLYYMCFPNTPLYKHYEDEKQHQEFLEFQKGKQRNEWRNKGLCDQCGGKFKGFRTKTCSKCGMPKQYT